MTTGRDGGSSQNGRGKPSLSTPPPVDAPRAADYPGGLEAVETFADRVARDGSLNELDAVGWALRLARTLEG